MDRTDWTPDVLKLLLLQLILSSIPPPSQEVITNKILHLHLKSSFHTAKALLYILFHFLFFHFRNNLSFFKSFKHSVTSFTIYTFLTQVIYGPQWQWSTGGRVGRGHNMNTDKYTVQRRHPSPLVPGPRGVQPIRTHHLLQPNAKTFNKNKTKNKNVHFVKATERMCSGGLAALVMAQC